MICNNCGTQNSYDSMFCANCGAPVKEENTIQEHQPVPAEQQQAVEINPADVAVVEPIVAQPIAQPAAQQPIPQQAPQQTSYNAGFVPKSTETPQSGEYRSGQTNYSNSYNYAPPVTAMPTESDSYGGMAIAGFVISLISPCCCAVPALLSLIFSIIGLKSTTKKGFAIAGLIISIIIILIAVVYYAAFFSSSEWSNVFEEYERALEQYAMMGFRF